MGLVQRVGLGIVVAAKNPMKTWGKFCLGAWLAVCLFAALPVQAHLLNMTEVHLQVLDADTAHVSVKIDLGQSLLSADQYWTATQLATADAQVRAIEPAIEALRQGLQLKVQQQVLQLELMSVNLNAVSAAAIRNPLTPQMAELTFHVAAPVDVSLDRAVFELTVMPQLEVPWPALIRADLPLAQLPVSRLLTEDRRSSGIFSAESRRPTEQAIWTADLASWFQEWVPGITWVAVGFQHIIPRGLDHIVFVLGLFFLAPTMSVLLYQVSCFTLAHSLTLGLATLGWIAVPASIVEPLIAASIVYVALDNLYSKQLARWRLLVITGFGLLHGLGFASALRDLSIPPDNFVQSLLLFNVGVELGQLAVLAIAFMAVGWMRHRTSYATTVARPATVTIAGVGAYWLIKRVVL